MSKLLGRWLGFKLGLFLGGLSGVLYTGAGTRLVWAQSTIFFSPALALHQPHLTTEGSDEMSRVTPKPSPLSWAESLLTSKEAVDMLCKKLERTESEHKAEALRAACLLPDGKRTVVEAGTNSCMHLRVAAEDPKTSILLCNGLLAYLNFKTKIALEDPNREELTVIERQLRAQELSLSKALWGQQMEFTSKDAPQVSPQELEIEMGDYQTSVSQYRRLADLNFFRETRTAAANPFFTVIEPPYIWNPPNQVNQNCLFGLLMGGALGFVVDLVRRNNARAKIQRNVRWRAQEPPRPTRTGSTDG